MANQMWMGIPGVHAQYVPCPLIDSSIARNRYIERMQFENGGGDVRRSSAYQLEYQFNFSGPAHTFDGIDALHRFGSGFYGDDLVYVSHPANFNTNLFSAAWASPGIIETGWKNIYGVAPTFANTNVDTYNQPRRTATWNVTTDINVVTKKFTILIPPAYTLHLGASGVATGAAVVRVRPTLVNNTISTPVDLTLLSKSASTRMNTTFSGGTYSSVDVYITRTSTATSTISLTSMMAQLHLTTSTPTLTSDHYQGEGSTGLMFADDAIVETYSYMYPPRKGISTTLVEVEAWR